MENSYFPEHINNGYFCNCEFEPKIYWPLYGTVWCVLIIYHNDQFILWGAVNASEVVYWFPFLPGMIMILNQHAWWHDNKMQSTGANTGFEFGEHKILTKFMGTKIVLSTQFLLPPWLVAKKIFDSHTL